MKILTISNYYPPYYIGGYEIACKETMDFLHDKGHQIHVLTSNYTSTQENTNPSVQRQLQLIDYANTSEKERDKLEYDNYEIVREFIRKERPDIVYIWSLRKVGIKLLDAINEYNVPRVFEIGDFWMYGYRRNYYVEKLRGLLPFSTRKPLDISPAICVSHWVQKEMHQLYRSKISYVIPNATTVPSQTTHKNNTLLKFIFVGRIDEEKGLDLAIKALKEFSRKYPHFPYSFDIYGSGDANYIQKCKENAKPIIPKVHFKGKIDAREAIYADASILLMPTRMREPFGLVLIEAMAYNCAVIATNAFGPAEIIQHEENGLLFESNSVPCLLKQIEKVCFNEELLHSLQQRGYEHVVKNYAIERVKPKVEHLLKKISGVYL